MYRKAIRKVLLARKKLGKGADQVELINSRTSASQRKLWKSMPTRHEGLFQQRSLSLVGVPRVYGHYVTDNLRQVHGLATSMVSDHPRTHHDNDQTDEGESDDANDHDVNRFPSDTYLNTPDELTELISEEKSATSVINELKKGYVYNEIRALIKLSHKHIISLRGVIKTQEKIELLFPNAGTSLQMIGENRSNPSFMFLDVMSQLDVLWQQLLSAVRYLGKKGWCHMDIKPGNIVVRFTDGKIHGTLIDLGSSRNPEDGLGFGCYGGFTHPSHCQEDYLEIAKANPPVGECDSWIQGLIDKKSDEYSLALSFYSFVHGEDKMMEAHSQIKSRAPDNDFLDDDIRDITFWIPEERGDEMFSQIKGSLTYHDLSDLKLKICGDISAKKRKMTRESWGSRGSVQSDSSQEVRVHDTIPVNEITDEVASGKEVGFGCNHAGNIPGILSLEGGSIWAIGCEYDMGSMLQNQTKEVPAHNTVFVNEIGHEVASGKLVSSGCHHVQNIPGILSLEGGSIWAIGCEYDMGSMLQNQTKEVLAYDTVPVNEIRDQVASGGHVNSGCHHALNIPDIRIDDGGGVNGITDHVPLYERLEYRNLPNFHELRFE